MRLTVNSDNLAMALSEVAPFAPKKPAMEIQRYARITTKGDRMKIEAGDGESAIVKYINTILCDTDGQFLVSIADFNAFVSRLKNDNIDIVVNDETIEVIHSKGKAELQTVSAKEYPEFNIPSDNVNEFTLQSKVLHDCLVNARPFIATETIRPMMCTIYAYIKDGNFGWCASDTHKLIHGFTNVGLDGDFSFYIMPSVIPSLITACKKGVDSCTIKITDKHASFCIGDTIIHSTMFKGKYPDFNRVIPQDSKYDCEVDKMSMMDTMSRLRLFCASSFLLKLDFKENDLCVTADNLDYQKRASENLKHSGINGKMTIGVSVEQLQPCFSVFDNGNVRMFLADPGRPIVMRQDDKPNITVLTMPMQVIA